MELYNIGANSEMKVWKRQNGATSRLWKNVDLTLPRKRREVDEKPLRSQLPTLHSVVAENDISSVKAVLATISDGDISNLDEHGMSPLHYAARHGLEEVTSLLVANRATLDVKGMSGSTALHLAIRHRRTVVAALLLKNGSNPNLYDENGMNGLILAAKNGLAQTIKLILETDYGVDVDAQDLKMNTALHYATIRNDIESFKVLFEHGAKPNVPNSHGETILHLAAAERSDSIITFIHSNVVNSSQSSNQFQDNFINQRRSDSKTALHIASQIGDVDTMKMLVEMGSDLLACTRHDASMLHLAASSGNSDAVVLLLQAGVRADLPDNHKQTALHWSVDAGHTHIVQTLVENGANVDAKDEHCQTPLLLAAVTSHTDIALLLLKHSTACDAKDASLKNSLHYIAKDGNEELAKVFLKRAKTLVYDMDLKSRTPVHCAAKYGKEKILELFKKETMQLNEKDGNGNTPLHLAAKNGHASCVELIAKDAGKDIVNCTNAEQQTPLHFAVISKQFDACNILLTNGADMNLRDTSCWTALHHAAAQDDATILETLLQNCTCINIEDDWSHTPLMVAAESGNVEAVLLLMELGADLGHTNGDGDNFFDLAIEFNRVGVSEAVLKSDRWVDVLRSKDPNGEHFMKKLVERFPDLAEIVLDRSTTFSEHHPEHVDFSVTFDYQFLEEQPLTNSTISDMKNVLTRRRNALYFAPVTMAEFGREKLMSHPIITSLFGLKWNRVCRYIYYLSFLLYLIFIISLTVIVMLEGKTFNDISVVEAKSNATEKQKNDEIKRLAESSLSSKTFGRALGYLIFLFCSIQILKEVLQLLLLGWRYFASLANYVEIVLYATSVYYITSFIFDKRVTMKTYETGIVCIFLGWANTLLFLQRIPLFRLYIVMFVTVCFTILKLLIVFSLIIMSFSLTFYLLFIRQKAFGSPLISLYKVLVMVSGEFEFEDAVTSKVNAKDGSHVPYVLFPTLSYVVFILFVFLVAVAFTNLLIGLAVGDIENIRGLATVSILEQQLEFISSAQEFLPKFVLQRYVYVPKYTYFINRKSRLKRFLEFITSDTKYEDLKALRMKHLALEAE